MDHQHLELAQALGPGGGDVVLLQHIQHLGADEPGEHGGGAEGQGDRGQHGAGPAGPEGHRQDAPLQTHEVLQQGGHHEVGHTDAQHGNDHGEIVNAAVMLPGGYDTQRQAHQKSQQHRLDTNEQGGTQPAEDDVGHRTAGVEERGTQVAPDQVAQVLDILYRNRIIEAVLFQHLFLLLGGEIVEALGIEGGTGELLHQEEGDGDDNEESENEIYQTFADIFQHSDSSFPFEWLILFRAASGQRRGVEPEFGLLPRSRSPSKDRKKCAGPSRARPRA